VRVDASEARVDRLWSGIAARLPGRRRGPRLVWAVAGLSALAVALLVARGVRHRGDAGTSAWEGARLETGADALSVALVDGSRLTLAPSSRVEFGDRSAAAVRLTLARGRLACDVTHRPGRSFTVAADGVEVRVVGTRFSVSSERNAEGTRVEVSVERGVVEVRGAGPDTEPVRVEAGRSWSQVTRTGALSPAPALAPAEERAEQPAAETAPPPVPASRPTAPGRAREARDTDARALFEEARRLWRGGNTRAAADAYQALLHDHPRDGRAGLAAFELGRLRMDRLGDLRGAVEAFERAVALAPGAELREDALARLASASAGAGDRASCARSRDRYLADYPAGVHRRAVEAACDAR
jgi:transmembrane sensor